MKERSFHGKLGELSPGERQALRCLLFPCLAISWFIKQVLCLPVGPDSLSNGSLPRCRAGVNKRARCLRKCFLQTILCWLGRQEVRGDWHSTMASKAAPASGENVSRHLGNNQNFHLRRGFRNVCNLGKTGK